MILMRNLASEQIEAILELSFWGPYRQLRKLKPRKEFIRPVIPSVRLGKYTLTLEWTAYLPAGSGRSKTKGAMIPHRLSIRKNGNTPLLKGIPNVTPELREIIQSVCRELSSIETTLEYLGQMTRSLVGMMGRYQIRADELLFNDEEMEAASFGYNPGIEADVARFRAEVKDRRQDHGAAGRPVRAMQGVRDLEDLDDAVDLDDVENSDVFDEDAEPSGHRRSSSRGRGHTGSILDALDPKE
jgi:hypothetical protein